MGLRVAGVRWLLEHALGLVARIEIAARLLFLPV